MSGHSKSFIQNEQELFQEILEGNEGAFCKFHNACYALFFHFTNKVVQNNAQSEHIVSVAFEKLWNNKSNFTTLNAMRAFMYTVCRNSSMDYFRALKRAKEVDLEAFNESATASAEQTNALHAIIQSELVAELHFAIQQLPQQQKVVIKQLFLDNLSTEKVAASLGISTDSVRSHKRHAIAQLRKTAVLRKFLSIFLV